MKHGKNLLFALLVSVLIALVIPNSLGGIKNVSAAKLNVTSKVLAKGKSFKLKLKGATGKVTFKSLNPAVAKVNKTGKVKILTAKKTTILVKHRGKTYKCKVRGIPQYTYREMGQMAEREIKRISTTNAFVDYSSYSSRLTSGKYHYDVRRVIKSRNSRMIYSYGELFIEPHTGKAVWKVFGQKIKFNCA